LSRDHRYFVYLLASEPYGTLYVGVTGNLAGRTAEHRDNLRDGFTKKYGVHRLVWFEELADVYEAILREKRIKKWNRAWKVGLIEKENPVWDDLFERIA
jgi:putative endonuclease